MKRKDIVADDSQLEVKFDRRSCNGCGIVNAVAVTEDMKTNIGKPGIKESQKPKWQCKTCDRIQVYR
jgi:hypothetical protein